MKALTNLDLVKNQLLNCVIQNVAVDPTAKLVAGWIIFNADEAKLKYYNGEEWVPVGSGGGGSTPIATKITESSTNAKAAGAKAVYDFVTENFEDIRAVQGGMILLVDKDTGNITGIPVDSVVTEDSANLITSGAVFAALQQAISTKIERKTNAALTPVDGVAEWTISDVEFSDLPSVSIYETSSGEQVLADVSVDTANSEITITFKNVSDTIASGYYTAVIVV